MMPRSRTARRSLSAGVVVALALGALVWIGRSGGDPPSEPALPESPARGSLPPGAGRPRPPAEPPGEARVAATGSGDTSLDEEVLPGDGQPRKITGRVVFPPGTPADPELAVRVRAQLLRRDLRAPVDGLGRFAVEVPRAVDECGLELDSRWLLFDSPVALELGELEDDPPEFVLTPQLGGVLRGQVTLGPRPGHGGQPEVSVSALSVPDLDPETMDLATFSRRRARVDAEGHYELAAVPAEGQTTVSALARGYVDARSLEVEIEPGRETVQDFHLRPGVRLAGRVVDEQGGPIENARVRVVVRGDFDVLWGRAGARSSDSGTTVRGLGYSGNGVSFEAFGDGDRPSPAARSESEGTEEDGAFEFLGLPPGEFLLEVRADGFLEDERELGRLAEGQVVLGLELALDPGASLSGRVLWPDGTPARNARVEVVRRLEDQSASRFRTKTGDDGRFVFAGLRPGVHALHAQASARSYVVDRALKEGRPRPAWEGRTTWAGELAGVRAPGSGLRLELGPLGSIRGQVIDDQGQPLKATVHARRRGVGGDPGVDPRELDHGQQDGSFELEELLLGTWELWAEGDGHEPSARQTVTLSGELSGVVLQLRGVHPRVTGVIVDAAGDAVPFARLVVWARVGEEERGDEILDPVVCDSSGRFDLPRVPPGLARLGPQMPGRLQVDEFHELQVHPDGDQEHVVVQLWGRASLVGRLSMEGGSDQAVRVEIRGADGSLEGLTVRHGSVYSFADLAPCSYEVCAWRGEATDAPADRWSAARAVEVTGDGPVRLDLEVLER